jgi:glycerol uptake facilitator-like aquaporin
LILTFGPVSGAHFNPAVTLADASQGGLPWRDVPGYTLGQVGGAVAGVRSAHLIVQERVFMLSLHERSGAAPMFSEFGATFGLLAVIRGCSRRRSATVPVRCCCLHSGGVLVYRFNIICQSGRDIRPGVIRHIRGHPTRRCAGLVVAQFSGACAAMFLLRWLVPSLPETAECVVVPRSETLE